MENAAFLDTHFVVWLHHGKLEAFSDKAKEAIEKYDLYISPMVELELEYLFEIDRIKYSSREIVEFLERKLIITVDDQIYPKEWYRLAQELKWTRDPFDRLITAHAALYDAPLLTMDNNIRKHYSKTIQ